MPTYSFTENIVQFAQDCYYYTNESDSKIDSSNVLKFFNKELFVNFNPDINGYVFVFFIPPPFKLLKDIDNVISDVQKFMTFAAIDFSPPQIEVTEQSVNTHLGGVSFVKEIGASHQLSITYLDNNDLSIYSFHHGWIEYMKGLVEGIIPHPSDNFPDSMLPDDDGEIEDGIDYMGSFFIVKYDPSFSRIKYIGKATGVFPKTPPTKELIGQRTSNELTTLPFSYMVTKYQEAMSEDNHIYKDLSEMISIF